MLRMWLWWENTSTKSKFFVFFLKSNLNFWNHFCFNGHGEGFHVAQFWNELVSRFKILIFFDKKWFREILNFEKIKSKFEFSHNTTKQKQSFTRNPKCCTTRHARAFVFSHLLILICFAVPGEFSIWKHSAHFRMGKVYNQPATCSSPTPPFNLFFEYCKLNIFRRTIKSSLLHEVGGARGDCVLGKFNFPDSFRM